MYVFTVVIALIISGVFIAVTGRLMLKNVLKNGLLTGSMFFSISILFYLIVPMVYLASESRRDKTTLYNRLILQNSNEQIAETIILCCALIALMMFMYAIETRNGRAVLLTSGIYSNKKKYSDEHWKMVYTASKRGIQMCADVCLGIGLLSQLLLITAVGGMGKYLALGSLTRGIGKDATSVISSAFLPIITLSTVILVAPFLYRYMIKNQEKTLALKFKFTLSFVLSITYLLYNQGRLPILLFFIPFILDINIPRKRKIMLFAVLAVVVLPLLTIMDNLFIFLTYGYWGNSTSDGFINTLLLQFTYPFGNFLNRGTLINEIGFRNCLDYIQWPLAIIPSSILKLFGISKSAITSMGALTTDAYMSVMNSKKTGGIPADFLLFNYAQLGYISLLIAITVVMRFLKAVDRRIYSFKDNSAFSIVILRICLLMISTVNNFDFAVIFRMRTDLVILIAVVFWVYKKHKTVERYSI